MRVWGQHLLQTWLTGKGKREGFVGIFVVSLGLAHLM